MYPHLPFPLHYLPSSSPLDFPSSISDMLLQWSRIEAHLILDIPQAITILETIVNQHDPNNWKIWEEFINMQIQIGKISKCHNIFQK